MPAPSGKTTKNSLPYPLETDGADPARDFKALAEALDALINTAAIIPIGGEAEYAGENDPSSTWLVEDGRAISRATYATLFGIIGTKYGAGDGSTTFNIPDCRGRMSIGAGTGSGLSARGLAAKSGFEQVKLEVAHIPSHNHGGAVSAAGAHTHSLFNWHGVNASGAEGNIGNAWGFDAILKNPSYSQLNTGITDAQGNHSHSISSEGGSQVHENMPPFIVKNKIIRAL